MLTQPETESNDTTRCGGDASESLRFGANGRYEVVAIHSRFDAVSWFVYDHEQPDSEIPECPAIIRQESTFAAAVAGWPLD